MKAHYVEYRSPGSFFFEESLRPIESWDTRKATQMAREVVERHGARPFCFRFLTRVESGPVKVLGELLKVEPKIVEKSGWHFLGGEIVRYDDVPESEDIARCNMRNNGYPLAARYNGRRLQWLDPVDLTVHPETGAVLRRASDPDLAEYSKAKLAEWSR